MSSGSGQLSTIIRTLGWQLKKSLSNAFWPSSATPPPSPRVSVVAKVSRNALAELLGRAQSQPQRGLAQTTNPAYVALAELTNESGRPGLALGLKFETGEISFLDLDATGKGGLAFVEQSENVALWHRLEELIYQQVDRTMVGPRKPIRPPQEVEL